MGMIRQFIDDSVFQHLANDTNAYELWEKLKCMRCCSSARFQKAGRPWLYHLAILLQRDCTWIIDSGASCHLTHHQDFFSSYTSGDFGYVKMGKGEKSPKIIGMDTVCLKTNTGCRLTLRDVRHVPEFRFNLISGGGLNEDGYASRLGEGKWKLTKGSLIVARDHGGEDGEQYCGDDVARDGDVLEPPRIEHGVPPQRDPQKLKFERVCYWEEVKNVHQSERFQAK
ncbi:unnamed protein product [Cuscuta campestris]|uniref:Retrovirus-related Pol polyprotein from transposon TNT 1-94-like beta-barrel domain-containing protein n=1 Tax=Cuscuta campestris TaxID=132261 RepID=A0A484LDK7_9ASTE|nr:unnamed protein product [Cuscuta campestris]